MGKQNLVTGYSSVTGQTQHISGRVVITCVGNVQSFYILRKYEFSVIDEHRKGGEIENASFDESSGYKTRT